MRSKKKIFFTRHAKSSAALISLILHAILLAVAISFVAVTVITKEENAFEAKPVRRPKMQLKKLQVPVNIKKKKTQKPKLRKRIVVVPKINQNMPDIKMPEITGVKGSIGGGAAGGLGSAGGVGFAMPEMELFGVKSKGEKVFIVLEASGFMMVDEIGGIPAYVIIKSELVRLLEGLNPTVLFNIAIYDGSGADKMIFPTLVPATKINVAKVYQWLKPLNAVSKGMGDGDYGNKTAGAGGIGLSGPLEIAPLKDRVHDWAVPAMVAMRQQADVVYILSNRWGHQVYEMKKRKEWSESKWVRYRSMAEKAKIKHKEENDTRRATGLPPRVITQGDYGLVFTYYPGEPLPPQPEWGFHTPKEMVKAFANMRAEHKPKTIATKSGLGKRNKTAHFSLNVIQFTKANGGIKEENFSQLASLTRGEYRMIEGMAAIESYVSRGNDK